jgi:hypothetical protein
VNTQMEQAGDGPRANPQPNEVDRKRIERALKRRTRYRYVTPRVRPLEGGYRIESPCCSRNIDRAGGVVDVAWLEYLPPQQCWRLHRKDHREDRWVLHTESASLAELLQALNQDPQRIFWQ